MMDEDAKFMCEERFKHIQEAYDVRSLAALPLRFPALPTPCPYPSPAPCTPLMLEVNLRRVYSNTTYAAMDASVRWMSHRIAVTGTCSGLQSRRWSVTAARLTCAPSGRTLCRRCRIP